MSRLMQLPALFIRGSIATQTMPRLTSQEIDRINQIVRQVENEEALAPDKHQFIYQLGATIKSDYKSDPMAAMQEFRVAIWRATVHLLYHREYQYICSICGATEYETCTRKIKAFDRQSETCLKCGQTYYNDNIIKISKTSSGEYIGTDYNGHQLLKCQDKSALGSLIRSPINIILGSRRVADPEAILADDVQRGKWYTVWIWNYFRQIFKRYV